jgi:L-amino acid N-acyltransferase YncA
MIREARLSDIPALQPILEQWVTDRDTGDVLTDEVAVDMDYIAASINGLGSTRFLVAEENNQTLGIMGVQPPAEAMLNYTTTQRPAELTYALVSDEARGKGIGTNLVNALSVLALEAGATELVVASSPRYEKSGWAFWKKLFGEPVGLAEGYGGSGGDALVWRKPLGKAE